MLHKRKIVIRGQTPIKPSPLIIATSVKTVTLVKLEARVSALFEQTGINSIKWWWSFYVKRGYGHPTVGWFEVVDNYPFAVSHPELREAARDGGIVKWHEFKVCVDPEDTYDEITVPADKVNRYFGIKD